MPERNDYTYEADDGYVYPGGDVLINRFGIRDEGRLAEVERAISGVRYAELEERPIPGGFDLDHLRAIHRHLFGDIYPWAGKIRTRGFLSKGGSIFCLPEFIPSYAEELFGNLAKERHLQGLGREAFVERMAFYIAEINALHPFREGNGRTQRAFANQLARNAGWELNLKDIDPRELCDAYIESMHRSAGRLEALLREHLRPVANSD